MSTIDTEQRFSVSDIEFTVTKKGFVRVNISDGLVMFDLLPSQASEVNRRLALAHREATEKRWNMPRKRDV
jgi:hypothetical protein